MPQGATWSVVERCLALLVRLTRGPATPQDLREIVKSYGDGVERVSPQRITKRLGKDLAKLRSVFGSEVVYADGMYTLTSMDRPLIDLPPDAMRGLAFLQTTFDDDTAPMRREVQAVYDLLLMLISETGRDEVERVLGLVEVDLRQRDSDQISDA